MGVAGMIESDISDLKNINLKGNVANGKIKKRISYT